MQFFVENKDQIVALRTIGKSDDKNDFFMDDILIREKAKNVFRVDTMKFEEIHALFHNNQRIRIPIQDFKP